MIWNDDARRLVRELLWEGGTSVTTRFAEVQVSCANAGVPPPEGAPEDVAMHSLIQLDGTFLIRISQRLGARTVLPLAFRAHQARIDAELAPLAKLQALARRFETWALRANVLIASTVGLVGLAGTGHAVASGKELSGWALFWAGTSVFGLVAAAALGFARNQLVRYVGRRLTS